jgi:hypothetical protein
VKDPQGKRRAASVAPDGGHFAQIDPAPAIMH